MFQGKYKAIINPFDGQLQLVNDNIILTFKTYATTILDLPLTGNTIGDARFVNDEKNLYVWNGTNWINQGQVININLEETEIVGGKIL